MQELFLFRVVFVKITLKYDTNRISIQQYNTKH